MDPKKRFGLHNRSSQLQLVSTSVNRHRRLADVVVSKPNDWNYNDVLSQLSHQMRKHRSQISQMVQ